MTQTHLINVFCSRVRNQRTHNGITHYSNDGHSLRHRVHGHIASTGPCTWEEGHSEPHHFEKLVLDHSQCSTLVIRRLSHICIHRESRTYKVIHTTHINIAVVFHTHTHTHLFIEIILPKAINRDQPSTMLQSNAEETLTYILISTLTH